jgi:hypothetical protein
MREGKGSQGVAEGNYKVEEDTYKVKVEGRIAKEEEEEPIAVMLGKSDHY